MTSLTEASLPTLAMSVIGDGEWVDLAIVAERLGYELPAEREALSHALMRLAHRGYLRRRSVPGARARAPKHQYQRTGRLTLLTPRGRMVDPGMLLRRNYAGTLTSTPRPDQVPLHRVYRTTPPAPSVSVTVTPRWRFWGRLRRLTRALRRLFG